MDYLYINAIVREVYSDLPVSHPFPEHCREMLLKASPADAFLKDPAVGSVISYFTLKERGKEPVLVMSRVERQKTCASVGRLTQCCGWAWDKARLFPGMDALFLTAFREEDEIIGLAHRQETVRPHRETIPVPGTICLSQPVRSAILATVMRRWLHHKAPLRIAVPSGVDYNSYVLAAVREIYQLFPVALRAEAGFCSYLPNNREANPRIYIGFVPEVMADASTLFLDGSGRAVVNALNDTTGRNALDQFIKYLCVADSHSRQLFLEEILRDVEFSGDGKAIAGITPRDYIAAGDGLILLNLQGSVEELLPRWKAFYEGMSRYPDSMRIRIENRIADSLDSAAFCRCVRREYAEKSLPQGVFDVLEAYSDLCSHHPHLADTLWSDVISFLHSKGISCRQVYDGAAACRNTLTAYMDAQKLHRLFCQSIAEELDRIRSLPCTTLRQTEVAIETAKQLLHSMEGAPSDEESDALRHSIADHIATLDAHRGAMILAGLDAQFRDIVRKPAQSSAQIGMLIEESGKLLQKMDAAGPIAGMPGLMEEVRSFTARMQAEKNSAGALFHQIMDQLHKADSYFAMLEVLSRYRDTAPEAVQSEEIVHLLRRERPSDMRAYAEAFRNRYGTGMNLTAISRTENDICSQIIRDICDLNRLCVRFAPNTTAMNMDAKIGGARAIGGCISDSFAIDVSYDGSILDSGWFRKLLMLKHDKASMGHQHDLTRIFNALVDSGAYSGDQMVDGLKMLENCGLDWNELFRRVLQGKFTDCTPQQYQAVFRAILDMSPGKRTLHRMRQIADRESSKDKAAERAFRAFLKKNEEAGRKGKTILIPILIITAVLLAGLVLAFVIGMGSEPAAPVETQPTVMETEATEPARPEVQYPELFYDVVRNRQVISRLYSGSSRKEFAGIRDSVALFLSGLDETAGQLVIDHYLKSRDSVPGDSDRWTREESFFWECWILAENPETDLSAFFSREEPHPEALEILNFLYSNQPEPAGDTIPSAEALTETTPDPDSGVTEAPAAETTQPTMQEIISAVTAAAEPAYAAATPDVDDILTVMALFGSDLDRTFDDHEQKLNQLLHSVAGNPDPILRHYISLPSDTIVVLRGGQIKVTWQEFVFWECWILAQNESAAVTDDSFSFDLHEKTLKVLELLHNLPDVDFPEVPTAPGAEETVESEASTEAAAAEDNPDLSGLEPAADAARVSYDYAAAVYRLIIGQLSANNVF